MTADIDDLKKHSKVLDLYLSRLRMKKEGSRYKAKCPFHHENTPSFDIHLDQGTWIYGCFGCGVSGNIFQFIQKTDNLEFKEAVRVVREATSDWYQGRQDVEQTFKNVGQEEPKDLKTYSPEEYAKYEHALKNSEKARAWLQSRGIAYETARLLRLGYRQSVKTDYGNIGGQDVSDVADQGWISFPTLEAGKVTSVKYRSIIRKAFCKQPRMGTFLFGTDQIDFLEPVFLVEGELDGICLIQAGLRAVSLPGASYKLTPEEKDLLLGAECVILAGDSDQPGQVAMSKMWSEMQERTYLLKWPGTIKDANQFFLETCKRDVSVFRTEVERLAGEAKTRPMEGVYDVRQSLLTASHTGLIDHPDRLRLPWPSMDSMAIITPGTVTTFYSTDSGMGKSTMVLQATLHGAMHHGEVVVNYQAEMMPGQIDTIIASHLLRKDRLQLVEEDYRSAGRHLGSNVRYYIGRNTSLTNLGAVLDLMEKAIRRFGATVAILDNLHFLARNEVDPIKAQANAMQRITNLAGSLNVKWILVHQARKADQNHKRKVTHVSDLDGSKAVQNDSSVIFSIHRDEIKHAKTDGETSENEYDPLTEIRLQKSREKGPGGSYAKLMFLGSISTFSELSYDSDPQNGLDFK